MQNSLTSIIKIQKVYKGFRARKLYQNLLAEKILKVIPLQTAIIPRKKKKDLKMKERRSRKASKS